MISVCMATKNGERFLREQLDSILAQLGPADELIISDDASTDGTCEIILSYGDSRIKLLRHHVTRGIVPNFETCLRASSGEVVFLADQDDVWLPHKIPVMLSALTRADLAVSDCLIVDRQLKPIESFFSKNNSGRGLLKNLVRNSYMGCCMAFRRSLLERALPFPPHLPMHDVWLGMIAEIHYSVIFVPEILVYHRKHGGNATTTAIRSSASRSKQFSDRYRIIKNLILHKSYGA